MHEKLTEYARLAVRVGVNIQKGQTLVLNCPVDCAYFARLIADEAYNAGAREVVTRWSDDTLTRMKYLKGDDAIFDEVPEWLIKFYEEYSEEKAALLHVDASDPENLKGVPPDRIQRSGIASGNALKFFYNQQMRNDFQWCIVSIPAPSWAVKVFPGVSQDEAMDKLWDAIFSAVRIGGEVSAVDAWQAHVERMDARAKRMNEYRFDRLIYKNSLGTDLTVELPECHQWVSVGETAKTGALFVANMPSEEVFTVPKRDGVNGVVCSSLPLSLHGNLVKDIKLTLKDGKIVDAQASEGLEHLQKDLDLDEGARYLGEAALVPYRSPISDMGILFYNTLFDENASCHFAYGKAYPAFTDVDERTEEELKARGANDSITHIDFMVGTPDLSITGVTADGTQVPVFINGNFAF